MLDSPFIWLLAIRLPSLFTGRALHRAALHATAAGASPAAEALFERAAEHYRMELEVEALARLRVHQLIARVRASRDPRRDAAMCLEVEQRLTRLARIESLVAPFELVPASRLLASCVLDPLNHAPAAGAPGAIHEAA
ncbi:MAG: hypothetical protein AAB290_03220 [Candidatus Eisenbacteria bacterium]